MKIVETDSRPVPGELIPPSLVKTTSNDCSDGT